MKKSNHAGFYQKMYAAFTNDKRKKLYQTHPKKGFGFINWEIEEELWRFQKEIETKFKVSDVNNKFKFPLLPHTPLSFADDQGQKSVEKKKKQKTGFDSA